MAQEVTKTTLFYEFVWFYLGWSRKWRRNTILDPGMAYVLVSNCACNYYPHGLRLKTTCLCFESLHFFLGSVLWLIVRLRNQSRVFLVEVSLKSSRITWFFHVNRVTLSWNMERCPCWLTGCEYFMSDACPNLLTKWVLPAGLFYIVTKPYSYF